MALNEPCLCAMRWGPHTRELHSSGGRIGGRSKSPKKLAQSIASLKKAHAVLAANPAILRENIKKAHAVLAARPEIRRENIRKANDVLTANPTIRRECLKKARAVLDANPEILRENIRKANAVLAANPTIRHENGRRTGRKFGPMAVESGQLARSSRGVPSTADGIRFRSQTEAMFYCIIKELGGKPEYEPGFIKLPDGAHYMPDFKLGKSVLGIPAGIPVELKPSRNSYNLGNVEKAVRAGADVIYWDELVEE